MTTATMAMPSSSQFPKIRFSHPIGFFRSMIRTMPSTPKSGSVMNFTITEMATRMIPPRSPARPPRITSARPMVATRTVCGSLWTCPELSRIMFGCHATSTAAATASFWLPPLSFLANQYMNSPRAKAKMPASAFWTRVATIGSGPTMSMTTRL